MKFFYIVCSLLVFQLSFSAAYSQELLVNFQYFTVDDGLSDRNVYCVNQDDRGMIWFGTANGLNRFDGTTFRVFKPQNDSTSSPSIRNIKKDAAGNFWLVKRRRYPELFNPASHVCRSYNTIQSDLPAHLEIIDPEGLAPIIYFKNEYGQVYHLNEQQHIVPLENLILGESRWVRSTSWGTLLVFDSSQQKIHELDNHGNIRRAFSTDTDYYIDVLLEADHSSTYVIEGKLQSVPLDHILFELKESGDLSPIRLRKNRKPIRAEDLPMNEPTYLRIAKDRKGRFWLVSGATIWLFDHKGHFLIDLSERILDKTEKTWTADHIFLDDHDRLWVTSGLGIFLIQVNNNPFSQYLQYEHGISTRGIYELSDDQLLVGTYQGAKLVDKHNGQVRHLATNYLQAIAPYKNNLLRAGMHGNRYMLINHKDHTFKNNELTNIKNIQINTVYFDKQTQTTYLATYQGLYILNEDNNTVQPYPKLNGFDELQRHDVLYIHSMENDLWLATSDGLYQIDKEKGVIDRHSFLGKTIKHFHIDRAGDFWLATHGGGLIYWNRNENYTEQFTTKEGLSNDILYAVYEDDSGQLWLPSNRGLMRFNKQSKEVTVFQPEDGITHEEFNTHSHFQAIDGRLYFGGLNGVTAFYPHQIKAVENDAPFIITYFQQFDSDKGILLDRTQNLLADQHIVLQPKDKFFNLSFSLLDYCARQKSYAWKIEGFDEDWTYQMANSIRINALPPGQYELHIKAKGLGGRWANEKITIPIQVLKPFYLYWQFIAAAVIIGFLLVYGFMRYRLHLLQQQKLKLKAQVAARTQELSIKNQELEQLNRSKDRFFAIIAHDLRSPLISLGGIAKKVNYLIHKNRTNEIQSLGNSVEEAVTGVHKLLDNLLQWAMVQGGHFPHNPEFIEATELLREIMSVYKNVAEAKNVRLNFDFSGNTRLYADRDALSTVLRNLIDNAIKFTHQDGSVAVRAFIENKQSIIQVQDSGLGIPNHDLKDLFVLNKRKGTTGTGGEQGTGLGLVLCKELVEMNGGQIKVASQEGKGTTFWVFLPLSN